MNCPTLADSIVEGEIRWDKAVGDAVSVDETIGEIETDKVCHYALFSCLRLLDGCSVYIQSFLFTDDVNSPGSQR